MPVVTRRGSPGDRAAAAAQPVPVELDTGFSVPAVRRIVDGLSEQQQHAVKSIGFGGLLHLHRYKRLDRHFAAWLAGRLVVSPTGSLFLEDGAGAKVPVTERDVCDVLGVPNGKRPVGQHGTADADTAAVRRVLGLDDDGGPVTLQDVVAVLTRRKEGAMTQAELDAFVVAFAILAVGHFLAPPPGSWCDKVKPEMFHAIANPSEIEMYNWAEYVLRELPRCAVRVRQQIASETSRITLSGCLLFLQIFYLERLDFTAVGCGVPPPKEGEALVAAYNDEIMSRLIKEDLKQEPCAGRLKQFGNLKFILNDSGNTSSARKPFMILSKFITDGFGRTSSCRKPFRIFSQSTKIENTNMESISQHGLPEIESESEGWHTAHSKSLVQGDTENSGSSSEETSRRPIWSAFPKVCTIL